MPRLRITTLLWDLWSLHLFIAFCILYIYMMRALRVFTGRHSVTISLVVIELDLDFQILRLFAEAIAWVVALFTGKKMKPLHFFFPPVKEIFHTVGNLPGVCQFFRGKPMHILGYWMHSTGTVAVCEVQRFVSASPLLRFVVTPFVGWLGGDPQDDCATSTRAIICTIFYSEAVVAMVLIIVLVLVLLVVYYRQIWRGFVVLLRVVRLT